MKFECSERVIFELDELQLLMKISSPFSWYRLLPEID